MDMSSRSHSIEGAVISYDRERVGSIVAGVCNSSGKFIGV